MYTPGTQQDPYTHAITAPSQGYSQPESLTQDNSQYDQTYGIAYRPGQDETYDAQHGPSRDQDFYKSEHQHQTAGGSAYDQDQPYTQPTSYPTQDPQQQYTSYPTQDSQQQQSSSYQDYQQPMAISSSSDYYAVAAGHPPSYKTNQTTGAGHGAAALRDEKPRQYW